ncbi:MAG: cobalt transporter CbiM [Phaeobacter italicus]|mgnify:CR=1 FL=1|uniref:Energy-coupling factor transporter probable substrate-capture protein NikMN n=1 Tax=Phaeobacter italicus TaxID=481446 RepID=A0A0H5D3U4_9RHOB|nr:cobalt transporter CbiM [Phaeobacter italicus]EEB70623.1 CbiM [Ruegeria sp. R11]MEC8015123.1 cobalt transporter CbiM [Pseudomonadota bacterium]NKX70650.1 cobalt transporter CbiM [Rhodobacteraceae bacterium R_SAG1]MBO9441579.1 cobalt transporter CbiM [Phaeobacter italicus]MBY5976689.1 cobalt transporter CbiM [Phaeobacter italicus]
MHIVDGALSNPVVIGGAVAAVGGIAMGLRNLPLERIPAAGVLSASFFVASLIHVPIGPSSVHLILNGLAGLVLGWAAFPALFVGLLLQAVFFGFGGLTVLGVNALNIALPAVLVGLLFRPLVARGSPMQGAIWGGIGGGVAIAATTLAVAFSLMLSGDEFILAAQLVFFAHIPVMVIEAVLSGAAIFLARRVKPELFHDAKGGLA